MMVHPDLMADFKRQVLQWDGAAVLIKDPRSFLGQKTLKRHKMHQVVIYTEEPPSTREDIEMMVKF